MNLKNQFTKTPFLVLFIVLISIGVGTASALTITLGGTVDITQILNMMGNRITNVGTPTQSSDAATKGYVDQSPTTDTLASLGCSSDQIARWDGVNWVCSDVSVISFHSITLDIADSVGQYSSIAVGTDGFPVISYYDFTNDDLELVHCTNLSCSTTDPPVTLDSTGTVGRYTSIAIGSDGFPVISYYDATNANLKLLHCTNVSCSTNSGPVTLALIDSVGEYTSIAIGTDGFPVISYYDSTNGDLKLVHCQNVVCGPNDPPVTLDSTGTVGLFTSIAIGSDGFPVISYYDSTNGNLKLLHCTNISCSTNSGPITLDLTGDVGHFTSIAIGSDGFPVISYFDVTNTALKLVHCQNVVCGPNDPPVTLDSTGTVGLYSSIAIGSDGFPVVIYNDPVNADLKMVHCTNISCSTNDPPVKVDSQGSVGAHASLDLILNKFPVISHLDQANGNLKFSVCSVQGDCIGSEVIFE